MIINLLYHSKVTIICRLEITLHSQVRTSVKISTQAVTLRIKVLTHRIRTTRVANTPTKWTYHTKTRINSKFQDQTVGFPRPLRIKTMLTVCFRLLQRMGLLITTRSTFPLGTTHLSSHLFQVSCKF